MAFILDTSVAMAWCFEDEGTPQSDAIFDQLQSTEAHVPAIWPMEVVNSLLTGERRNRLTQAEVAHFVQTLDQLPITIHAPLPPESWSVVLSLARLQRLSAYDAAYLELAVREGMPLATQDSRLRTAATQMGVALV